MRVLLAHNYYREDGGESAVFRTIGALLRQHDHHIIEYVRNSHEVDVLPNYSKIKILLDGVYSHRTFEDVKNIVLRERPDIALVQNVFPLLSPSIYVALRQVGVPVVQLIYNYRLICPDAHLYTHNAICERCVRGSTLNAVLYRCYRNSLAASAWYATIVGWHRANGTFAHIDHFLVPDGFMRRKLGEGGLPVERMTVIGNPFDLSEYHFSEVEDDYLLFIGRLIPQKGILTLIKAYARAKVAAQLVIIGDGESRAEAEQLANALVPHRIRFLSNVWGEETRRYIARALFVCIPSEWYDNAPLVLYQSYAFGKPVIASRINGLPEVVNHEHDGLLAHPGDVGDWSIQITRLASDSNLRRRLGVAARHKAETQFTMKTYYDQLQQVFDRLIVKST